MLQRLIFLSQTFYVDEQNKYSKCIDVCTVHVAWANVGHMERKSLASHRF